MDYLNATNEELERLVDQKDYEAACELGERCLNGTKGHERNLTRAYQLFHKGEKQGLQKAYLGLAQMYDKGIYLAKNENLARKYYNLAGCQPGQIPNIPPEPVPPIPPEPVPPIPPEPVPPIPPEPTPQTPPEPAPANSHGISLKKSTDVSLNPSGITTAEIKKRIENAENARQQENYSLAKKECDEAVRMLDSIASGVVSFSGSEDEAEKLRIDAYWIRAYTAFNEQHISELEEYLSKDGVTALHPWGTYLAAVSHREQQAPDIILEQDLQMLTTVNKNPNLSGYEKSDVNTMIAELILEGKGQRIGCTQKMAYDYYNEAAACGNQYAQEQLSKFQTTESGDVIYIG